MTFLEKAQRAATDGYQYLLAEAQKINFQTAKETFITRAQKAQNRFATELNARKAVQTCAKVALVTTALVAGFDWTTSLLIGSFAISFTQIQPHNEQQVKGLSGLAVTAGTVVLNDLVLAHIFPSWITTPLKMAANIGIGWELGIAAKNFAETPVAAAPAKKPVAKEGYGTLPHPSQVSSSSTDDLKSKEKGSPKQSNASTLSAAAAAEPASADNTDYLSPLPEPLTTNLTRQRTVKPGQLQASAS